jgi:hypothetical protein
MSQITTPATLTKLEGDASLKSEGQFVLDGQPLATDKGFKNVSHIWYDKTRSYDDGLKVLAEQKSKTEDILASVSEMVPAVDKNDNFAFYHKPTDRFFTPTPHAVCQAGNWAKTGTWYPENMLCNVEDYKGRLLYKRDRQDAETLVQVFKNGFRRLDGTKKFLFRVNTGDNSLRAMLTDRYGIVDNVWFVEVLRELIPGGRLSHWRGDGDSIYGNILIPDTIRADKDSDYGGMLSVGNCEIGTRRVSSLPSIFRAICMNGCIWGRKKGEGIRQVHRGRIVLESLKMEIKTNLDKQIPLLPQGIDKLLATRAIGWDGAKTSVKPVIAAIAGDNALTKQQATAVLKAWNVEKDITPDLGYTLFGVTNAVTRAGQDFDPETWVKFDEMGGELLKLGQDGFSRLLSKANGLDVKEVEEAFSNAA